METLYYSRPEIKITASGVSVKINSDVFVIQELDKISNIMLVTKSGYISIYALRLFSLKKVTLTLHNLNGEILYHIIPEQSNQYLDNRILQYDKFLHSRLQIAEQIIKAKREKYQSLLKQYKLPLLTNDNENVFSNEYFARIGQLFTDYGYNFYSRKGFYATSNQKAITIINSLLNFYYGLVEHRLLNDVSYYGLDYSISYLHEPQYNKLSLTYDLIEFLRSDIDNVVLKMAKDRKIKLSDFQLTDKGYYMLKEQHIPKYLKAISPIESKSKDTVKGFIQMLSKA